MNIKQSQCESILDHLKKGNTVTPKDAEDLFDCMRLGGRIYDLRQLGHHIDTNMTKNPNNGKRYANYKLIKLHE